MKDSWLHNLSINLENVRCPWAGASVFSRSRRISTERKSAELDHRSDWLDLKRRMGSKSVRSERSNTNKWPLLRLQTGPELYRDWRYTEPDTQSNYLSQRVEASCGVDKKYYPQKLLRRRSKKIVRMRPPHFPLILKAKDKNKIPSSSRSTGK